MPARDLRVEGGTLPQHLGERGATLAPYPATGGRAAYWRAVLRTGVHHSDGRHTCSRIFTGAEESSSSANARLECVMFLQQVYEDGLLPERASAPCGRGRGGRGAGRGRKKHTEE